MKFKDIKRIRLRRMDEGADFAILIVGAMMGGAIFVVLMFLLGNGYL